MQFIKTIKASLSSYNVDVAIDSVSAGSIVVTSTTTFLDGSQAGANAFAATIGSSTAAASLFPAATYGTVTSTAKVQQVANASSSPEEGSPSPEEASPSPPASTSNTSQTVSKSTSVPAVQAVTTFSGFSTPSDFGDAARANVRVADLQWFPSSPSSLIV